MGWSDSGDMKDWTSDFTHFFSIMTTLITDLLSRDWVLFVPGQKSRNVPGPLLLSY